MALVIFIVSRVKHSRQLRPRMTVTMVVLFAIGLAVCDGCGGAGTAPPPTVGTPAGVYSLVVTATANGNVTATTTINLTVN